MNLSDGDQRALKEWQEKLRGLALRILNREREDSPIGMVSPSEALRLTSLGNPESTVRNTDSLPDPFNSRPIRAPSLVNPNYSATTQAVKTIMKTILEDPIQVDIEPMSVKTVFVEGNLSTKWIVANQHAIILPERLTKGLWTTIHDYVFPVDNELATKLTLRTALILFNLHKEVPILGLEETEEQLRVPTDKVNKVKERVRRLEHACEGEKTKIAYCYEKWKSGTAWYRTFPLRDLPADTTASPDTLATLFGELDLSSEVIEVL
jgi:hypothetical protein